MQIQFIGEVSLGNVLVLCGVICVFAIAYRIFGKKVTTIEANVKKVEDILEHRNFKQDIRDALAEIQQKEP